MSEVHFTQKTCGAENGAAERELGGAPQVIAEQTRRETRARAKVSAVTKTGHGLSKERAQQSRADRVGSTSSGRGETAKASAVGGTRPADDVKSVAELAIVLRRDPDSRKKRLKLAEAFRECGLDEAKVAALLHALGAKLSQNTEIGAVGLANAKLLLDVLKESMHVLEPQKAAGISDSTDASQFIRLIHNVPRPVRTE
jgi:hypothetical protein